jgi:hypothetical protein
LVTFFFVIHQLASNFTPHTCTQNELLTISQHFGILLAIKTSTYRNLTTHTSYMASAANSAQYTYQRAGEMATRSLVSGSKSTEPGPSTSKPMETTSASSNDTNASDKPTLQRRTTNNYEEAAAAATKASQLPATTAGSAASSVTDRPGVQRQQSWKMSDLKGQQQGQMLAGKVVGPGYSTTQK